jgi:acetylornithine deacetylase/succinyl-diaminopimelate desuccinylase-like protein
MVPMHLNLLNRMISKLIIFFIIVTNSLAQVKDFPQDFKIKAFDHIKKISSFGFRKAGSDAEEKTIKYLVNYFGSLGLDTKIDTFNYKAYELSDINLLINGDKLNSDKIWIDPYSNETLNGPGIVFGSDSSFQNYFRNDYTKKIIIASDKVNPYRLALNTPKALIVLPDSVLHSYNPHNLKVSIDLNGKILDYKSFNIIASYKAKSTKEIIISAHWDSFNGPGASDNASGLSVLLELAKYLTSINFPHNLKFVAFGAEEQGLIGSKAFVIKYRNELEKIKFLFNIDGAGGHKDIYIEEQGGVRNSPKVGEFIFNTTLPLFATTDFKNNWHYNKPTPASSNVPDWLVKSITSSFEDQGYEYIKGNEMGSDHQVFFMSGVPATNICYCGGNKTHGPEDIPEQINIDGLEKTGKVVALVIKHAIRNEINDQ